MAWVLHRGRRSKLLLHYSIGKNSRNDQGARIYLFTTVPWKVSKIKIGSTLELVNTMPVDERSRLLAQDQGDTIVDWDGPEDGENPQNWARTTAWMHIAIVSLLSCLM